MNDAMYDMLYINAIILYISGAGDFIISYYDT